MGNLYADSRQKLKRPFFVPFTVLGDPNPEQSKAVIRVMMQNGADALELGLPFSDPPADGPVIQAADVRALAAGTKVDDCFAIIKDIRKETEIPIGLLVYCNLIMKRGVDRFYADCAESGVTSVLVADLPLEHADEFVTAAKRHGIAPVFLVSELTTEERLRKICSVADGYLYLVSYLGVTGREDHQKKDSGLQELVRRCRSCTELPLVVGFGIHEPSQVRAAVKSGVDGVIVGSRLVREMPDVHAIGKLCQDFAAACR